MLNWAIEAALGLIVALQMWLLRTVWATKLSRDEARQMFDEFEERDAVRDKEQLVMVTRQIDGLAVDLRTEHGENLNRFDKLGDKIDAVKELLLRPRGH